MPDLKERLIERVDRARASGRAITIDSPATRAEIDDLESRCGALPPDVRELLEYAAGFAVDGMEVSFRAPQPFEFEGMFACSVPIATDGYGNFWVVDASSRGAWGAVFFVVHDPPVAIIQARDVASFIDQVFDARATPAMPSDSAIQLIWERNPYVISRAQALASQDSTVRAFAQRLDEHFAIADLRDGMPGHGFVWGSAGPDTTVRRDGERLLFAVEQKRPGFFGRLFSR